MTSKLYLAGPSAELPRVMRYVEAFDALGVGFTCRWWDAVLAHGVGNDAKLDAATQTQHAEGDLLGVLNADVVWVLWPEGRSFGAPVEYGYALGCGKSGQCVVTGPRAHDSIFTALAKFRHADDNEGWKLVTSMLGVKP